MVLNHAPNSIQPDGSWHGMGKSRRTRVTECPANDRNGALPAILRAHEQLELPSQPMFDCGSNRMSLVVVSIWDLVVKDLSVRQPSNVAESPQVRRYPNISTLPTSFQVLQTVQSNSIGRR